MVEIAIPPLVRTRDLMSSRVGFGTAEGTDQQGYHHSANQAVRQDKKRRVHRFWVVVVVHSPPEMAFRSRVTRQPP